MRGRKPAPTYLKIVKGAAPHRINDQEARVPLAIPNPPLELNAPGRLEWERVAPQLFRHGILTDIDRGVLTAYCQAYGRWIEAERVIIKMAKTDQMTGAMMIKTTNGNAIQNPMLGIANKALDHMVRYAAELGMTPSARSRVKAEGEEEAGENRYINRGL